MDHKLDAFHLQAAKRQDQTTKEGEKKKEKCREINGMSGFFKKLQLANQNIKIKNKGT